MKPVRIEYYPFVCEINPDAVVKEMPLPKFKKLVKYMSYGNIEEMLNDCYEIE